MGRGARRSPLPAAAGIILAIAAGCPRSPGTAPRPPTGTDRGPRTVADRLEEYGPASRARLAPSFRAAGIPYPPAGVALVAIKAEKVLHVYAAGDGGPFIFIKSYPVLGASGRLGPKLREGDRQVPEGIYPIESLNPNSRYHLSLRIGYPGKFDREMARREGRTDLGGDIMIHGGDLSIGCLAVGDEAAEDLFVLAADAGVEKVCAVLAPVDFRKDPDPGTDPPALPTEPAWVADLYAALSGELSRYPPP